jgi:hypothetical protein
MSVFPVSFSADKRKRHQFSAMASGTLPVFGTVQRDTPGLWERPPFKELNPCADGLSPDQAGCREDSPALQCRKSGIRLPLESRRDDLCLALMSVVPYGTWPTFFSHDSPALKLKCRAIFVASLWDAYRPSCPENAETPETGLQTPSDSVLNHSRTALQSRPHMIQLVLRCGLFGGKNAVQPSPHRDNQLLSGLLHRENLIFGRAVCGHQPEVFITELNDGFRLRIKLRHIFIGD